jgi:hypothetical protein
MQYTECHSVLVATGSVRVLTLQNEVMTARPSSLDVISILSI